MRLEGESIGELWIELLRRLYHEGRPVSPRQHDCREIIGVTLSMPNLLNNLFVHEERSLNYRFVVAEWLWIWFGHDDVKTITQYNSKIAQFSDDGERFSGAYGPPLRAQWPDVLNTLRRDSSSRQAVIVVYRRPMTATKDVPCTLSWQFLIRGGRLHMIASMRSSDVWLGLPHDVFNFTMLANILAAQLHLAPGSFTIHLGSSHLYERDRSAAGRVLDDPFPERLTSPVLTCEPPQWVDYVLRHRTLQGPCTNTIVRPDELAVCGGPVNRLDPLGLFGFCSTCETRYLVPADVSSPWVAYAECLLVNRRAEALAALKRISE